jgi:hypothetical protein
MERDKRKKGSIIASEIAKRKEDRTRFANILLHEVKGPLRRIIEKYRINEKPSESDLNELVSVVNQTNSFIEKSLREFNKEESTEAEICLHTFEYSKVSTFGSALSRLSEDSLNSDNIDFNVFPDKPIFMKCCELSTDELFHSIKILVTNAEDAIGTRGGEISIFSSSFMEEDKEFCEILVKDNGPSFPHQAKEALKNNTSYTSKLKHGGTGFGLLNTKGMLEAIGGKLIIDDEHDGYKLVKLSIPVVPQPNWMLDISLLDATILILDDDPSIVNKVKATLRYSNPVVLFSNEADFLKVAEAQKEAFLLIDFDYGDSRNGLDLILQAELKSRSVLLTGRIPYDVNLMTRSIKERVKLFPKSFLNSENHYLGDANE